MGVELPVFHQLGVQPPQLNLSAAAPRSSHLQGRIPFLSSLGFILYLIIGNKFREAQFVSKNLFPYEYTSGWRDRLVLRAMKSSTLDYPEA